MGAFTHPEVVNLTVRAAGEWGLWHYPDFKDLKGLGSFLGKVGLLRPAVTLLEPDSNGVTMSEVNKVTYRTPDYALACAQDYRKGEMGYQQHVWQATLGPYAVVFTTNPDSLREDDKHRPSYWASSGRFPRAAQHRNVLVAIYDVEEHKGLLESRHYLLTHAYFPRWAFDEVVEVASDPAGVGRGGAAAVGGGEEEGDGQGEGGRRGGWVFGRCGDAYVALYSHLPYEWQTEGPDAGQEIIAVGGENVWVCQVGRRAVDGSFEDFIAAVSGARLEVTGRGPETVVVYGAPGLGEVRFGWEGPLTVNGNEVPLGDYPRFDNPYCRADFGAGLYRISLGDAELTLDFRTGVREFSGEPTD